MFIDFSYHLLYYFLDEFAVISVASGVKIYLVMGEDSKHEFFEEWTTFDLVAVWIHFSSKDVSQGIEKPYFRLLNVLILSPSCGMNQCIIQIKHQNQLLIIKELINLLLYLFLRTIRPYLDISPQSKECILPVLYIFLTSTTVDLEFTQRFIAFLTYRLEQLNMPTE